MIRYRWNGNKQHPEPIAFIGLSDENLDRLVAGNPIRIKADDLLGLGVEVVIHNGPNEVEMTRELEQEGFMPPGSTAEAEKAMEGRTEFTYERPPDYLQRFRDRLQRR